MIEALVESMQLKDELRTGQQIYNIEDPESIADHSWGVAFLTIIYGKSRDINMEKALKMSVLHDLGESRIGDIPFRANPEDRENLEEKSEAGEKAITEISRDLENEEIRELWKEFEERATKEAKFVKDMDHVSKCLQILKFEKEGRYNAEDNKNKPYDNLDEFFEASRGNFNTEKGLKLFTKIEDKYREEKAS